jgi:hypothetical protein
VAVMHYGRIVERGSADDIFHDPEACLYARAFSTHGQAGTEPRVRLSRSGGGLRRERRCCRCAISARSMAHGWFGGNNAIKAVDDVSFDPLPRRKSRHCGGKRLGQDDAGAHAVAHCRAQFGHGDLQWRGAPGGGDRALQIAIAGLSPPGAAGLPGPLCLAQSAHDGARHCGRSAGGFGRHERQGHRSTGLRITGAGGARSGDARTLSACLFGWPAAAHWHCPGAGARPQDHHCRRGDGGVGRVDPQPGA